MGFDTRAVDQDAKGEIAEDKCLLSCSSIHVYASLQKLTAALFCPFRSLLVLLSTNSWHGSYLTRHIRMGKKSHPNGRLSHWTGARFGDRRSQWTVMRTETRGQQSPGKRQWASIRSITGSPFLPPLVPLMTSRPVNIISLHLCLCVRLETCFCIRLTLSFLLVSPFASMATVRLPVTPSAVPSSSRTTGHATRLLFLSFLSLTAEQQIACERSTERIRISYERASCSLFLCCAAMIVLNKDLMARIERGERGSGSDGSP